MIASLARTRALFMAGILLRGAGALQEPDPRLDVPDAGAQKEQETVIRGVFRADYARPAAVDRRALALKLLEQATATKDNPAARFVLLRESRDLAAEGGDAETALKVVDQMATEFRVPGLSMKTSLLAGAAKSAKNADDLRRLAAAYLRLSDDAALAEDAELAGLAAGRGAAAARSARDAALVSKADAKVREMGDFRGRLEKLRKARQTLGSNPDDPEAASVVGEYLLLVKGDAAAGLPLLAKGADHRLRMLARRDGEAPTGAPEALALADAWWEQADREKGKATDVLRKRAITWYETALPGLSGVAALRVSERLASTAPAWLSAGLFAWWKLDEGSGGVISDSSGNRRGGKIDGATWTRGMIGSALHFDGNHQKVILDAGEVPPPWTAVFWVKREETTNPYARLLDGTSYEKGSSLRLEQSTSTHKVGISTYRGVDHVFDYAPPPGVWTQLAWVGTPKQVLFYANDKFVAGVDLVTPLSVDRLGSQDQMGLHGSLDEIRIYSRELSGGEIEALFHYTRR